MKIHGPIIQNMRQVAWEGSGFKEGHGGNRNLFFARYFLAFPRYIIPKSPEYLST